MDLVVDLLSGCSGETQAIEKKHVNTHTTWRIDAAPILALGFKLHNSSVKVSVRLCPGVPQKILASLSFTSAGVILASRELDLDSVVGER